jgi:ParB family chromosome partitioning protein
MAKPALGRGLGALLGGANPSNNSSSPGAPVLNPSSSPTAAGASVAAPPGEAVQRVALSVVHPCPFQPRKEFTQESLQELADSIREQGIIQPLIVRPRDGGSFELIAGERRWRAAQLLGLRDIPVLVRQADDRAVLELALIENLQRENLNPMEEAQGYAELVARFALRQEDVAQKVGKSRVAVANALRLLKLEPELQAHVRDGRLSVGHAKVILGLAGAPEQRLAAERVLKDNLSVRQCEDLVARLQSQPAPGVPAPGTRMNGHGAAPIRDVHVANMENRLCERFGTKVQLRYRQGKGAIEIRYFSDDELERILDLIGVKAD